MKRGFIAGAVSCSLLLVLGCPVRPDPIPTAQIIADHTAVARYIDIPPEWIAAVKKMWLDVPGESHSFGYRKGLELLAEVDVRFAVSVTESGDPEGSTDTHLRASRATWGDVEEPGGWKYHYGEEDWYTSATAIQRTKDHLTYSTTHDLAIAAMGFGWCWDMDWTNDPGGEEDPVYLVRWAGSSVGGPEGNLRWGLDAADEALTGNSVCLDTYLDATQQYIDYCAASGYTTKVFFTTGPVDSYEGESGYQRQLKQDRIRAHVQADSTRILFDYADILAWNDGEVEYTGTWNGHPYQMIHADNMLDLGGGYVEDGDHIGERGALRLAKALWWMLARIAGWDGNP